MTSEKTAVEIVLERMKARDKHYARLCEIDRSLPKRRLYRDKS